MAIPVDRASFKEYCLKSLGKPVIRVNVEDGQVEDRIDDAIQRYREHHYDAIHDTWVGYVVTQEDIDNGYITLPEDILTVIETMSLGQTSALNENGMFSYQYQVALQNLSPFQSLDMINYQMTMTNINEVTQLVNAAPRIWHTRHMNRLELYNGFENAGVDTIIGLRVYKAIDPDQHKAVYNDRWLKRYTTALIKRQWGSNMKKHGEVQLLGGVTVNGQQLFDEAITELEGLEEELKTEYSLPIGFFIG